MTSSNTSRIAVQQIDPHELKAWIKAQALDLGFADCVIAKPDAQEQMPRFLEYLERGYHADMTYLEENLEKRADQLYWCQEQKYYLRTYELFGGIAKTTICTF